MSECPKCGAEIAYAAYCVCGWKRPDKKAAYIEPDRAKCCHDACFISAICKVRTEYGWANFCLKHYEEHFQKQDEDYCQSQGLTTLAAKRKFVKEKLRGLFRMREPGEDECEAA